MCFHASSQFENEREFLKICSLRLFVCVSVPEQRMHSLLRLQRHGQTDPAEPQEPRGNVQPSSV